MSFPYLPYCEIITKRFIDSFIEKYLLKAAKYQEFPILVDIFIPVRQMINNQIEITDGFKMKHGMIFKIRKEISDSNKFRGKVIVKR